MPSSPVLAIPYPTDGSPADVPADLAAIATALDTNGIPRYPNTAARNTAMTNLGGAVAGMVAVTAGVLSMCTVGGGSGTWEQITWRTAWGAVAAPATTTAGQSGIGSSMTDLTGLTVTWTALAARRYKTTLSVPSANSNAICIMNLAIATGANVQVAGVNDRLDVASGQAPMSVVWVESGISGSQTRKARMSLSAGSGGYIASATSPALLLVEDIGPA